MHMAWSRRSTRKCRKMEDPYYCKDRLRELCNKKQKKGKRSQLQGKHFRSSWIPGRNPEVAQDVPQVSVWELLEQDILGQVLGITQDKTA
jgi:hypothetical protein